MHKGLFLLAGVALLSSSLVAAAAQAGAAGSKPQPQSAEPAPFKPAAERKEITVTEKVLKTYVGEYQMEGDTSRSLNIVFKDGSIWGSPTGQEPRQLFAETQTVFFLKDLPIELTFKKDAKGTVTGLAMNQNGRVRDLLKVK